MGNIIYINIAFYQTDCSRYSDSVQYIYTYVQRISRPNIIYWPWDINYYFKNIILYLYLIDKTVLKSNN